MSTISESWRQLLGTAVGTVFETVKECNFHRFGLFLLLSTWEEEVTFEQEKGSWIMVVLKPFGYFLLDKEELEFLKETGK